eukprot:2614702-Prymnesium_polylepis.1
MPRAWRAARVAGRARVVLAWGRGMRAHVALERVLVEGVDARADARRRVAPAAGAHVERVAEQVERRCGHGAAARGGWTARCATSCRGLVLHMRVASARHPPAACAARPSTRA